MNFNINNVEFYLKEESNYGIPNYHWFTGALSTGNWEKDTFNQFDEVSDIESVALDIGSWIGPTTIYLSKKFKKVISIEADKNAVTALRNNLNDNFCDNVDVLYNAIYNKNNEKILFGPNENQSEGLGDSMSQVKIVNSNDKDYEIETISLEEVVKRYSDDKISFVKVDIEGGEEHILEDLFIFGFKFGWKVLISFHYSWWENKNIEKISNYIPYIKRLKFNDKEIDKSEFVEFVNNNHFGSFFIEFNKQQDTQPKKNTQPMKICFLSEAHYPNYVNRVKKYNIKRYLELGLDIPFYISTNLPEEFSEYKDHEYIKIFDINELRKNNKNSLRYELLPEDPTGLYPAKYPWNLRRFIIRQAIEDGYLGLFFLECDTKINSNIEKEKLLNHLNYLYEPNTVKSSSARFVYKNRHPNQELFCYHDQYIQDLGLKYNEDDYDTLDGTNQLFFGKDTNSLLEFVKNWDYICDYGYINKEGYKTGYLSNLSFVIPMSNFKLIHTDTPFQTDHVFEDRYTYSNNINIEVVEEKLENVIIQEPNNIIELQENSLTNILKKYSSDKIASGYGKYYDGLFSGIKNEKLNILEIGVGTVSIIPMEGMSSVPGTMYGWKEEHKNYNPGASLRSFRDFFTNSQLFGIDIQPDCLIEEDRLKTFILNSLDKEGSDNLFENNFFDIIIDDGDHDFDYRLKTFNNFYPKLKKDGMYFIEGVLNISKLTNILTESKIPFQVISNNLLLIKGSESKITEIYKTIDTIYNEPIVESESLDFVNTDEEFKINNLKFADRGFFINLASSTDRLKLVKNQIKKFNICGLNRFEALTDEMIQFSCTKSHLKVFENSLIDDFDTIFVAEDDFMIDEECYYPKTGSKKFFDVISDVYNDLQNVEWDVILFGCNPKAPLIPITNNLAIVNKSTGAWGYLIKKRAFRYLLKNSNYRKDYIAVDDWLPLLNDKGFITLTTIPMTINHGVNLISTLQPAGLVNYDAWIKGSYHKFLYDIYDLENKKNSNLENDLTIVITGHFTENFLFHLNYLIHSLPTELKKCKFLINYDETSESDLGYDKLKLEAFFKDVKHSMNTSISYSKGGLISSIKNVLEKIKTPYFLFLEHDWVFLDKDKIKFEKLINSFNENKFVNAVWFSKDDNQMRGFEIADDINGNTTPFEIENRVSECNLITTCRWSNNPAMFRLSKFKQWYNDIIDNEYVDKINQAASNVEETMIPYYRNQIRQLGWDNVKDEWGTYLYGNLGEGPYVGHTDASRRYQGHSKSQPEINGENYIMNNPI